MRYFDFYWDIYLSVYLYFYLSKVCEFFLHRWYKVTEQVSRPKWVISNCNTGRLLYEC